jgi:trehalose 6-phosphate synthase
MFRQSGRGGHFPRPCVDSPRPLGLPRKWDRLVVLANRAPYRHEHGPQGRVIRTRTASGLVTALEPLVRACAGTWVAHAASAADAVVADGSGAIDIPSGAPCYRLRYVSLGAEEHRGFYYGFANEALWPLCHSVQVPAVFRPAEFRHYEAANGHFAEVVAQEAAGRSTLVLVQDYHFALAPRRIRKLLPSSTVAAFWHIPWPHQRVFRTCPWHRDLLDGLLGSDIIGFQTAEDAVNFADCVRSLLHAEVDGQQTVTYRRHSTRIGVYPVGVEWDTAAAHTVPPASICRASVLRDFDLPQDVYVGIGVDRLDYTKGLNEKVLAVELALERSAALRGRLAFIQVAEPSRDCLPAYRNERARLHETVARVNGRFGTTSYTPIRLLEVHHDADDVYRLYRAADVCYVGSLHDGMNVVAKEFVAARNDERGVLILSEFAGAAQQLRTAVLINPYDVDAAATALANACTMSDAEQGARLRVLRANVRACDARWWANRLLEDAGEIRDQLHGEAAAPLITGAAREAGAGNPAYVA